MDARVMGQRVCPGRGWAVEGSATFALPAQASGWEPWQRAVLRKEPCSLPAGPLGPPPRLAALPFAVFSVTCPVGGRRCQRQAPPCAHIWGNHSISQRRMDSCELAGTKPCI